MSNDFPAAPTELELSNIQYQINLDNLLDYGGTNFSLNLGLASFLPLNVSFSTPGSFGDFNQSTFESDLFTALTALCQMQADQSGQTLAEVQSAVGIVIARIWSWSNSDGVTASWYDTSLTYPA